MAEQDKIFEQKIKLNGIFNFKETYKFIYRWMTDEGYTIEEKKYVEEVAGDSKNIEIKWTAIKQISDYFVNEVKFGFRILRMKDVEVEKDGERIKTNKGTFEVKITGTLVKDYENTWETNPFMKFLRGVYDRYIIEGRTKKYENKLIEDVDNVTEQTKAFLAIEGRK